MNNLLFVVKDATSQNKMKTKNRKIVVFKLFCITAESRLSRLTQVKPRCFELYCNFIFILNFNTKIAKV